MNGSKKRGKRTGVLKVNPFSIMIIQHVDFTKTIDLLIVIELTIQTGQSQQGEKMHWINWFTPN